MLPKKEVKWHALKNHGQSEYRYLGEENFSRQVYISLSTGIQCITNQMGTRTLEKSHNMSVSPQIELH